MSEAIPFFSDLPERAVPSANRLWDQARASTYNGQTAYQDFVEELRFLHIEAPPRAIVKRWIAGVQAGLIERPSPAADVSLPEPVTPPAATSVKVAPVQQAEEAMPSSRDVAPDDIETFASRLFDKALAEIQRDAHAKAAKFVASQLRGIADRYEATA